MNLKAKKKHPEYECKECGARSVKWSGKCLHCQTWGSLDEIIQEVPEEKKRGLSATSRPQPLSEISLNNKGNRIHTSMSELDRVLGGGITNGSLILIGGDPGIGKSTLLLQMMTTLEAASVKALYITGEESPEQIKGRANRLNSGSSTLPILSETNLTSILDQLKKEKPEVAVVDSIQTMYHPDLPSSPGTETQLKEVTLKLMMHAKTEKCTIFLVGHVTKGGQIAGPKVVEHMVDTVIYFEGDPHNSFRILRSIKNRFGATNEIGVFEMISTGLIPVENPSASFIQDSENRNPGSIITCSVGGSRPILLEIQALVNKTSYSNAQRVAKGLDSKRLTIILALLEKFAGIEIGLQDVFVNVAGGLRVEEPATDLAIAAAVASNHLNKPSKPKTLVLGELGLNGDLRPVSHLELRIKEAIRMGFTSIIIPPPKKKITLKKAELLIAKNLSQALDFIFQ